MVLLTREMSARITCGLSQISRLSRLSNQTIYGFEPWRDVNSYYMWVIADVTSLEVIKSNCCMVLMTRERLTRSNNWVCIGLSRGSETILFLPLLIPRETPTRSNNWVCIGLSRGNETILFLPLWIPREKVEAFYNWVCIGLSRGS